MNFISNENENVNVNIHPWNRCHNCSSAPITGRRYHCESCPDGPDNDLCEPCYNLFLQGKIKHPADNTLADTHKINRHHFSHVEGKPAHLFTDWLKVDHPEVSPPAIRHPFVARPIFSAASESFIAGYGFVVNPGKDYHRTPLLLTALHVMDPMIKYLKIDCTSANNHYTGCELPSRVTGVDLFDVFAPNWMMEFLSPAGPMLVLPNARTGEEEPFSDRDIAVFTIPSAEAGHFKPAALAERIPQKGDPVWIVARPQDTHVPGLFKAVIVEIDDRSMIYAFEKSTDLPQYISGAPLVNRQGEVAGIIVGGGQLENRKLGHANHVANIRRHLHEAL